MESLGGSFGELVCSIS